MKKYEFIVVAIFSAILICAVLFVACNDGNTPVDNSSDSGFTELQKALRFSKDGKFKILHVCDLHESVMINKQHEAEGRTLRDTLEPKVQAYIEQTIDSEKPDLVVLGGDNLFCKSGAGAMVDNEMQKTMIEIGKLFDGKKVFWTLVFGNHDEEGGVGKKELFNTAVQNSAYFVGKLEDTADFYSFVDEKENMYGNMAVPIYDYNRGEIVYNIFTFDSGSYKWTPLEKPKNYRYIVQSQVEWYAETSAKIKRANNGKFVPAVAFTHIPLFEHEEFFNQKDDASKVLRYVGDAGKYSLSNKRSAIYDKMCEVGDVRGVFTGHNHTYNWTGLTVSGNGYRMMLSTTRQCSVWDEGGQTTESLYSRIIELSADGGFMTYEVFRGERQNEIAYE